MPLPERKDLCTDAEEKDWVAEEELEGPGGKERKGLTVARWPLDAVSPFRRHTNVEAAI